MSARCDPWLKILGNMRNNPAFATRRSRVRASCRPPTKSGFSECFVRSADTATHETLTLGPGKPLSITRGTPDLLTVAPAGRRSEFPGKTTRYEIARLSVPGALSRNACAPAIHPSRPPPGPLRLTAGHQPQNERPRLLEFARQVVVRRHGRCRRDRRYPPVERRIEHANMSVAPLLFSHWQSEAS